MKKEEDVYNIEWNTDPNIEWISDPKAFTNYRHKEVLRFLFNPENSHNCENCPYNEEFDDYPGHRLPCGQFNCWVDLHCEKES